MIIMYFLTTIGTISAKITFTTIIVNEIAIASPFSFQVIFPNSDFLFST